MFLDPFSLSVVSLRFSRVFEGSASIPHQKRAPRPFNEILTGQSLACTTGAGKRNKRGVHRRHLGSMHLNLILPAQCAPVKQRTRSLQSWMRIKVPILYYAAIRVCTDGPMHVQVSTL